MAISAVIRTVFKSLRLLSPADDPVVPGDSAFTYRRYQLGARPLVDLFHTVCIPMTTPQTPGAFLFGLRLVAIDGTVETSRTRRPMCVPLDGSTASAARRPFHRCKVSIWSKSARMR